MTEAGRRFGSLISSPAAAPEAFFYLSSIAEREGRTDLALEGYSKLAEAGAGLIVRGRAARLLLAKNERDAAFRMLDEHAAKERSETLDVEFAKAALLDGCRPVDRSHRAAAARARAFPRSSGRALPDRADPGQGGHGARVRAQLREPAQGPARRRQPAERARLFAGGPQPETAARRNADPQGARGIARQSRVSRQPRLGAASAAATFRARCRYLERAYRIFPDAEIASHWGELLWVSGKQSEARALWARSLARSPDSKPLRDTIERLTGTKLDPPAKPKPDAGSAATRTHRSPIPQPPPTSTSS